MRETTILLVMLFLLMVSSQGNTQDEDHKFLDDFKGIPYASPPIEKFRLRTTHFGEMFEVDEIRIKVIGFLQKHLK